MDAGRCAGTFTERPTEWITMAEILQLRLHVHVSTIMQYLCIVHVYMYALCGYTRHLRTCWYAAIAVNHTEGVNVKVCTIYMYMLLYMPDSFLFCVNYLSHLYCQ